MDITLIQTLADRDNVNHVEDNGPFKCNKGHAWLGEGYYFWDTHMELGHWWGQTVHSKGYIICSASGFVDKRCWDLHGNGKHRVQFKELCDEMVAKRITTKEKLTVSNVIEYLKSKGIFIYEGIRALGVNSISSLNRIFIFHVPFEISKPQHLDIYPPVQLCLINKNSLSLRNYRVVFPEEYVEQYT